MHEIADDDTGLLRRFARNGEQAAFAELARRKVTLVYAAALRQVGGDTHLAQDVTQAVFLTLAARAATLGHHGSISGWLYTTTRFLALKAVRTEARWRRREQEATIMNTTALAHEPAWDDLRPVIDAAMHDLGEKDRAALLLRFFEGRTLAAVGTELGLTENAARMRVERALEKLRTRLARRGITSTAAALSATLAAQPAITVPAGLLAHLGGSSLAGAVAAGGGTWLAATSLIHFMGTTKLIVGTAGLLTAAGIGAFFGVWSQNPSTSLVAAAPATHNATAPSLELLRAENQRLKAQLAQLAAASRAPAPPQRTTESVSPQEVALDQLRVLTDLQKRRTVSLTMPFLPHGGGGNLTPAFATLFALTPSEQDALQQTVDRARQRLAELAQKSATVERATNGDVTITVPSFAQSGGVVYDEFIKSFAETLGPERQSSFLTLGGKNVEKALGWFGAAEQTLTISQTTGPDGVAKFTVRQTHRLPNESGSSSSNFKSLDEVVKGTGTLGSLVPKALGGNG